MAAQHPGLVKRLDPLIADFLTDTKAVQPVRNPAFDPAKYRPELEGVRTNKKKPKPAAAGSTASSPRANPVESKNAPAAKGQDRTKGKGKADSAPSSAAPAASAEPILRHRFADTAGFKAIGKVTSGITLEGDELAASLARGGDGNVARFQGGRLVREDASGLLKGLTAFTLYLRIKPEQGYVLRGTLLTQRGPYAPDSGAFDVSAWAMPFIEREHLAFHGMIEGGLGTGPGRAVPSVNVDQDRHPVPSSGWRDVVITRGQGGPLRLYLDGRLVARRSLASNVPAVLRGLSTAPPHRSSSAPVPMAATLSRAGWMH